MRPGEPGKSYLEALRRWPEEIAGITDTELAKRIGVSRVSELLQNRPRWRPTPALLKHARKIIEVCEGEPQDVANWTDYHQQLATYKVTGKPQPVPPVPVRFATTPTPDLTLATADPTGDLPRRPRLRWVLRIAAWAAVFGLLAVQRMDKPDLRPWQVLVAAAFFLLAPLACLTLATLLMAFAGPRLDVASRRHQERSFLANVPDTWPVYALYLLVIAVLWSVVPLFDVSWISTEVKVLLTGVVVIAFVRMSQLQVREVTNLDTAWPPTVTADTLTFRRAATRLRQLLTADQPLDDARRRQAASVLSALAEVRSELAGRARMTWRQWLTQGPTKDPLPAVGAGMLVGVVVLDCAGLAIRPWQNATTSSIVRILAIIGVATGLAAVALAVAFHTQRRSDRRLAEELNERERDLRPLVFPDNPDDAAAPTGS